MFLYTWDNKKGTVMIIHYTYPTQKSKWHYVIRKYVWGNNFDVAKEDLDIALNAFEVGGKSAGII